MPSVERHRSERLGRDRATDRIEGDIDPSPVGHIVHDSHEILFAVVDAVVGSQRPAQFDLLVGARRRDHRGSQSLGQLHGGRPHTAGGRMDQHQVAGLHPTTHAQREVAQLIGEVHGDAVRSAEPAWESLQCRRIEQSGRGISTLHAHGGADDPVAEQRLAPGPDGVDSPGGSHTDDEWRIELQQAVPAPNGVDVVEVEAEGFHRDPDLACIRWPHLDLLLFEDSSGAPSLVTIHAVAVVTTRLRRSRASA